MRVLHYVKEMRPLIGHKPLLLCGASVILFNGENKVLMLQRSDNDCWCFPGGALDLGENLEETARREVAEEMGHVPGDLKLFGVFFGEELHYTYPNGDEVYIVDTVFEALCGDIEVLLDKENKSHAFFDLDHLPERISPPVIPVVRELLRRYGH